MANFQFKHCTRKTKQNGKRNDSANKCIERAHTFFCFKSSNKVRIYPRVKWPETLIAEKCIRAHASGYCCFQLNSISL